MTIRFYRNLPRSDQHHKSLGTARIGRVRVVWCGPVCVLVLP